MGFFYNMFTDIFTDRQIQVLEKKITDAETDEEREMYENELSERQRLTIHSDWF